MVNLETFFEEELGILKEKNLYRSLRALDRKSGVRAVLEEKEVLLFCGNDYLGLSQHPRTKRAMKNATDDYGTGAGAARLVSGGSALHSRLEEKLARLKKKQRALLFSAGYLANLGTLAALAGERDLVVMDKLCHASLIDGAVMSGAAVRIFPHKHYARLEEILEKSRGARPNAPAEKIIIVTDTVFSMDGDLADLPELVRIKERYGCFLVADDAHGTGVLGLSGGGAAEDLKLEDKIDVFTGTLSKALGGLGGFAAASGPVIEYLINRSRPFIFATALPAALAAAAIEALRVIEEEPAVRHRLWRNIQRVYEGLASAGFEVSPMASPIFPIVLGDEARALEASQFLLERGIFIPAIRPPAVPKGKARLRLTVSAEHTEGEIAKLLGALREMK